MLIVDTVFHFVLISCQSNSRLSLDDVKTYQKYPYLQADFIHLEWLYKFNKHRNEKQKQESEDEIELLLHVLNNGQGRKNDIFTS